MGWLKRWRRRRASRRILRAVKAGRRRPVLVYQMGKVGSTTVQHALESRPQLASFHVHHIAPVPRYGRGHRRELSGVLWRELVAPGVPCPVITLTREPAARHVSAFFQNLREEVGGKEPWRRPTAELADLFLARLAQLAPTRWFETELAATLGVDVYGAPFDPALGYVQIAHPRYPTLLLRSELPDADKGRLIGDFLGLGPVALPRANVGTGKAYAAAYAAFRNALRIPPELLDVLYESRYAQHFYTPAERAAARRRWGGSQPEPDGGGG